MHPGNEAFDLAGTFILINENPTATAIPLGPDFRERLEKSPIANSPSGRLISLGEQRADWGHWEMHPASDEILILLSGSLELILEEERRERSVVLNSLNAFVVPRGVWHRARSHTREASRNYRWSGDTAQTIRATTELIANEHVSIDGLRDSSAASGRSCPYVSFASLLVLSPI